MPSASDPVFYALARDDGTLTAFQTERELVAACEGIDVEDGVYRFFDAAGRPLLPHFTSPNQRGRLSLTSGTYILMAAGIEQPHLASLLGTVTGVEGCGLRSIKDVEAQLIPADR